MRVNDASLAVGPVRAVGILVDILLPSRGGLGVFLLAVTNVGDLVEGGFLPLILQACGGAAVDGDGRGERVTLGQLVVFALDKIIVGRQRLVGPAVLAVGMGDPPRCVDTTRIIRVRLEKIAGRLHAAFQFVGARVGHAETVHDRPARICHQRCLRVAGLLRLDELQQILKIGAGLRKLTGL